MAVRSRPPGVGWLPQVLCESGWDWEKGVGGPGRLHPRLLFNSQILAGGGRARASWVPGLLLAPRARARGGGSSRLKAPPSRPGRRQSPWFSPPLIYMLIVSGKSSFIGRATELFHRLNQINSEFSFFPWRNKQLSCLVCFTGILEMPHIEFQDIFLKGNYFH